MPVLYWYKFAEKYINVCISALSSERPREQTSKNNPEFNTHLRPVVRPKQSTQLSTSRPNLNTRIQRKRPIFKSEAILRQHPAVDLHVKWDVVLHSAWFSSKLLPLGLIFTLLFGFHRMRGWRWPQGGSLEWSLRFLKRKRNTWHQTATSWRNTSHTAASPTHTSMRSGPTST